jgi:hypothetical protein
MNEPITYYTTTGTFPDSQKIPAGTVTVLKIEDWMGDKDHKPMCSGCGLLTVQVAVKVADNLGPYGGTWCWPGTLDTVAVGRDGSKAFGGMSVFGREPMLSPEIYCYQESEADKGWLTFDTPRGFEFDHLELDTYPGEVTVVRRRG